MQIIHSNCVINHIPGTIPALKNALFSIKARNVSSTNIAFHLWRQVLGKVWDGVLNILKISCSLASTTGGCKILNLNLLH